MQCPHCGQAIKGKRTDSEEVWRARLALAFVGVDIEAEMVRARRWIALHPTRHYTRRFVERWLDRADKVVQSATEEWQGIQVGDPAEDRREIEALKPKRKTSQ